MVSASANVHRLGEPGEGESRKTREDGALVFQLKAVVLRGYLLFLSKTLQAKKRCLPLVSAMQE